MADTISTALKSPFICFFLPPSTVLNHLSNNLANGYIESNGIAEVSIGGKNTTKYLFPYVDDPIGHRLDTQGEMGRLSCCLTPVPYRTAYQPALDSFP